MIWIDYAILAIVGISGVFSLRRGFVKEVLSLAGWIAAFWIVIAYSGRVAAWLEELALQRTAGECFIAYSEQVAAWLEELALQRTAGECFIAYSEQVAAWLEGLVALPSVRVAIGSAVLFVAVLLACVLVQRAAGALVAKTGMSGTDRTLGIVFGVLRGVVIVGLLVLLAGLTPLPRDPWWSESSFLPHFVDLVRVYLPVEVQQHLDFDPEPQLGCDPEQQPDCEPEQRLDAQPES